MSLQSGIVTRIRTCERNQPVTVTAPAIYRNPNPPTPEVRLGTYANALSDVRANLIFTSPPYNIGSQQSAKTGLRKHGLYDPKSYGGITGYDDALPEDRYQDQQAKFLIWCGEHLTDDGVLVYNHKPRRREGAMVHPASWFLRPEVTRVITLMEEITWDRGSTHNHSNRMMWNHTERLYVFRRSDGKYPLLNTGDLPQRSDVWRINRPASTGGHACPFSTELADAVISAWSKPGDLVCDPYTGSGTTAVSATRLGREFVGAEKLAKYHRLAQQRIAAELNREDQ